MTLSDANWRYPVSQKGSLSLHQIFQSLAVTVFLFGPNKMHDFIAIEIASEAMETDKIGSESSAAEMPKSAVESR